MKKPRSFLAYILFFLAAIFPLGFLILDFMGYTLVMRAYTPAALIGAVLFILSTIFLFVWNKKNVSWPAAVFLGLLLPLTTADLFLYTLKSGSLLVLAVMTVWFICALLLAVVYARPVALKVVSVVISATLIIPAVLLAIFITSFRGGYDEKTVYDSFLSPDGGHIAEIVDVENSIFEDRTSVYVSSTEEGFKCPVFELRPKARKIYSGDWLTPEEISVYWESENTLNINGDTYSIIQ